MTKKQTSKPNILLITTDQQRADHLGVKGLSAISTPNLDRLATEGAHFDRAYCPSPICTPTRMSLLTGRWPSSHGAYSIGVTVDPPPRPTLPELLQQGGYATALIGKAHFVRRDDEAEQIVGVANPDPATFRTFNGPSLGFDWVRTCIGHTINCEPDMHYRVFLEDACGQDGYKKWFPRMGDDYNHRMTGAWDIPEELQNTAWVAKETQDWLMRQAGDRPWFVWTSFEDPHEPFVCPEPWYSSVDTARMELFEGKREGEFDRKPAIYEQIYRKELAGIDDGHGVPCVQGPSYQDGQIAEAMQATLGMIANIDDKVGRILRTLEETGQLANTIVIYTSDHGEMHGHHGFWGKGLTAYEDCQRVPLLIWGPSHVKRVGTTQAIANLADLPATILAMAGLQPATGMQGTDLTPILEGAAATVQDSTIVECQATRNIYQMTFITADYKLILYRDSDQGELYDLRSDPDQYDNLWEREEYRQVRAALLQQAVQKQLQREGRVAPRQSFA